MNIMRNRITILMVTMVLPVLAIAQAVTTPETNIWEKIFGNVTLIVGGIVVLGALFAVAQLFNAMAKLEEIKLLKEKGIEDIVEAYKKPQPSMWERLSRSMTKAVPVEREADVLLDHNYDGITELDNKLPPWWLWLFYATVIFSVVYMAYYHLGPGENQIEEYTASMEKAEASVTAYVATLANQVDEENMLALTGPEDLEAGKAIYMTSCVACHGNNGEGNTIGPNLTDEYWIHGGSIKNLYAIIKNGVIEKGMQPWKDMLRASDMQLVASYILSLQGSNPPNAKAPQGELWKPEAPAEAVGATQDTTTTTAAEPEKTQ